MVGNDYETSPTLARTAHYRPDASANVSLTVGRWRA